MSITIVIFILILSLLIFVHEFGHFVVAKWAGITVEEFAIGFPPRAVKLWQGEGSIVLEGKTYVIGRKLSMPRSIQVGSQVYAETSVDEQGRPVVKKLDLVEVEQANLVTKDTASNSNKLLQSFQEKIMPTAQAAEGRPTMLVERLVRPTEYTINWIPLGGYVRMVGEEDPSDPNSFAAKSKRIRFAVLVAGSAMNLLTAVFFFTLTAMSGVPEPTLGINNAGEQAAVASTIVTDVLPNSPAAHAGLQADDIIVGAEMVVFEHTNDLVSYVELHKGEEITLQVLRNEEFIDVSLTPRVNPPENEGSIGIALRYDIDRELVYYPPHEAVVRGVQDTATYVGVTFYMPIAVLNNLVPAEVARPTGPVGIYQITGSAIDATLTLNWWFPVLQITAILSAALAITNLLPFPALDGGRIFFIVIEAIRGKRISPEKEGAVHLIGLAVLFTLMIVITYYDFSQPITDIVDLDWSSLTN